MGKYKIFDITSASDKANNVKVSFFKIRTCSSRICSFDTFFFHHTFSRFFKGSGAVCENNKACTISYNGLINLIRLELLTFKLNLGSLIQKCVTPLHDSNLEV